MSANPMHRNPPPFPGHMAPAHGYHPGAMHPSHRPHYHGFCHSCCHPMHSCLCGVRQCRKEAKELLVTPDRQAKDVGAARVWAELSRADLGDVRDVEYDEAKLEMAEIRETLAQQRVGADQAFIGGGCCVHLSIEYTANSDASGVAVMVTDAEGTVMLWAKRAKKQGYYIKEGIITTNPGARLLLVAVGATARVRWCEVFSC